MVLLILYISKLLETDMLILEQPQRSIYQPILIEALHLSVLSHVTRMPISTDTHKALNHWVISTQTKVRGPATPMILKLSLKQWSLN